MIIYEGMFLCSPGVVIDRLPQASSYFAVERLAFF